MPIAVDSYYQSRKALNGIEEECQEMVELLGNLYLEPPASGLPTLSLPSFKDYVVVSAVLTISTKLKKETVTFGPSLLDCFQQVYVNTSRGSMEFPSFFVNKTYERAVIFGCVYYYLSLDKDFPKRHLCKIEQRIQADDMPYFKVFKDAADKKTGAPTPAGTVAVDNNRKASNATRIVLAKNRNSDFTRIVQAMIQDGYFCHADKSAVTAKEVGEMMLNLVGVSTAWDSMLQKAFSRDNPLKTFDNLRDVAQRYWAKRANIQD